MNNKNEIIKVSSRYEEASIRFREAWLQYVDKEEEVKFEIVNMVKILEKDGLPRMQAIKRIIDDHKDLPGFSQKTIYRQLPDDMKVSHKRDIPKLENDTDVQYKGSHLSSDKSENLNTTSAATRNSESQSLKDFRESKGTETQEEEPDIIEQLGNQNLQPEPIQQSQSFEFRTMLEYKDQQIPLIVTAFPDKQTGYAEVDMKLAKKLRGF